MNPRMTIDCDVFFRPSASRGRGDEDQPEVPRAREPGRIPRVSRLMALAIRCGERIAAGEIANNAEIAALGHVTRSRVTQIMNLLHLSPDIQEALLFLPRTRSGRDSLHLRLLQPIAAVEETTRAVVGTHGPSADRSVAPGNSEGCGLLPEHFNAWRNGPEPCRLRPIFACNPGPSR